jgi:RimJ/RimL family protein N-acetyltransferase
VALIFTSNGMNECMLIILMCSGFTEEGRKREAVWQSNEWHDAVIMGLLRREWEAGRVAKQK